MAGSPESFREVLKEFRAADASLSNQIKLCEDTASTQCLEVTKQAETARRIATEYVQRIEDSRASAIKSQNVKISPENQSDLDALHHLLVEIKQLEGKLNQLNSQLRTLDREFQDALAQEEQEKRDLEQKRQQALLQEMHRRRVKNIARAIIATGALCAAGILHFWLLGKTTLSFDISIDGKPAPADKMPNVALDANSFTSGGKVTPGHHRLFVGSQGIEPIERGVWTFYGKNNLGVLPLEFSKGSLSVTVRPSPAVISLQRDGHVLQQSDAPLKVEKLPTGDYSLIIRQGTHQETVPIRIERQKLTETNIVLNLGDVWLFSEPPDAEFDLLGDGKHWQGKLTTHIEDLAVGTYQFIARRKGWSLERSISVNRGEVVTNKIEFQYGTIEVTSEPAGLIFSTNDVEAGKTPLTLAELKPGQYKLTITDGGNDLTANANVNPKEAVKQNFVFHYGTVRLASTPAGATVIRKGKEVGKTPLLLERIPAAATAVELRLDGFATTNLSIVAQEGVTTNYAVKLFSKRYLAAIEQAQQALDADQLERARQSVIVALETDPADSRTVALKAEVDRKINQLKHRQASEEQIAAEVSAKALARQAATLPILNPENIIRDCWNTTAEPLPSQSQDEIGAAAVPIYVATKTVTTTIKIVASPLKLPAKKAPRFDQARFVNNYQNRDFRYYGTIANIDAQNKTIAIAPVTTLKQDGIHESEGKVIIPTGNTSKLSYAVVAHLRDGVVPAAFSLKPGAAAWISGKLTSLGEADKSLDAANQLILDNATVYPPNSSPSNTEESPPPVSYTHVWDTNFSGEWSGSLRNTASSLGITDTRAGNYRLTVNPNLKSGTYYGVSGFAHPVVITQEGRQLLIKDAKGHFTLKLTLNAGGTTATVHSRVESGDDRWGDYDGVFRHR